MTEAFRRIAAALCAGALLVLCAAPTGVRAEDIPAAHAERAEKALKKEVRPGRADAEKREAAEPAKTDKAKSDEAKSDEVKSDEAKAETVVHLPPIAVTSHTLKLDGQRIPYTATAASLTLHDKQGASTAEIFYVAYDKDPKDTKRPVTFVFNGGPGAAAAYLHLGAIGPRIIAASDNGEVLGPPARLLDNDASWLGFTDLVFVDPVGTGYSRATGGKEEDFWGVDKDTASLAEFIRLYLTENARMSSPVFITGESYGAFRAATITSKLQESGGVSPSGLVLVSPALEFALIHGEDYDPLSWALPLPSFAAVRLESEGVTGREALGKALKPVEDYAMTDYLVALASGAEEGGKEASARVAELTGLPADVVERYLARISSSVFIKEFDRDGGQLLSRYDGSVGGPDPHPTSTWPRGPDPVLDATVPLWTSAFVQYARDELAYETDENYRLLNREVSGKWDFGTSPRRQGYAGVMDDIQEARAANRELAVMIATGYTDLITPYLAPTYLVKQLPPLKGATPITVEDYAGGHMLYLRPESRRALKEDVEAMYRRALGEASQG